MNARKNMRARGTRAKMQGRGIGTERLTGGFSGGGAFFRRAAAWCVRRLLRRRCAAGGGGLPSLWANAAGSERGTREREQENGTVRERGVSRGLFIGTAGPQTARTNCARSINAPGFGAHVRAARGVTVASCNGHIVRHGV